MPPRYRRLKRLENPYRIDDTVKITRSNGTVVYGTVYETTPDTVTVEWQIGDHLYHKTMDHTNPKIRPAEVIVFPITRLSNYIEYFAVKLARYLEQLTAHNDGTHAISVDPYDNPQLRALVRDAAKNIIRRSTTRDNLTSEKFKTTIVHRLEYAVTDVTDSNMTHEQETAFHDLSLDIAKATIARIKYLRSYHARTK